MTYLPPKVRQMLVVFVTDISMTAIQNGRNDKRPIGNSIAGELEDEDRNV